MSLWTANQRLVFDDLYNHPNSNPEDIAGRVGRSVKSVKGLLAMMHGEIESTDAYALHNDLGEFIGTASRKISDSRRWFARTAPGVGIDWTRLYAEDGSPWSPPTSWYRHGDEKVYPADIVPFYADEISQQRNTAVPGYGLCHPGEGAYHICKRLGS